MRIDFAYKALRRIAHPDIHNVGADVLLTDRGERMAQAVSRFSASKSFIISLIFKRCKSAVSGLFHSISSCVCFGTGIFLYSIFPLFVNEPSFEKFRSAAPSGDINAFTFLPAFFCGNFRYNLILADF